MRFSALAGWLALTGVAACSANTGPVTPMETGIGFGSYQRYLQRHETSRAAGGAPYSVPPEPMRQAPILPPAVMPAAAPSTLDAVPVRYAPPPPAPVPAQPLPATMPAMAPVPVAAAPLAPPVAPPLAAAVTARPLPPPVPVAAPPAPAAEAPAVRTVRAGAEFGTTPAFDAGPSLRPTLSDEQDFEAVAARESIESDRDRIERQRQQYQVIEVASVPGAGTSGGPNIVAFALSVSHAPGTEVYRRLNPLRFARWQDNCLRFTNQDAAQEAFLSRGGPQRDPDNLDPDGDGYACWWDPTPLRQALAPGN